METQQEQLVEQRRAARAPPSSMVVEQQPEDVRRLDEFASRLTNLEQRYESTPVEEPRQPSPPSPEEVETLDESTRKITSVPSEEKDKEREVKQETFETTETEYDEDGNLVTRKIVHTVKKTRTKKMLTGGKSAATVHFRLLQRESFATRISFATQRKAKLIKPKPANTFRLTNSCGKPRQLAVL